MFQMRSRHFCLKHNIQNIELERTKKKKKYVYYSDAAHHKLFPTPETISLSLNISLLFLAKVSHSFVKLELRPGMSSCQNKCVKQFFLQIYYTHIIHKLLYSIVLVVKYTSLTYYTLYVDKIIVKKYSHILQNNIYVCMYLCLFINMYIYCLLTILQGINHK